MIADRVGKKTYLQTNPILGSSPITLRKKLLPRRNSTDPTHRSTVSITIKRASPKMSAPKGKDSPPPLIASTDQSKQATQTQELQLKHEAFRDQAKGGCERNGVERFREDEAE